MEKNAHAHSNAIVFPSLYYFFKKVSQSASQSVRRRLTNLQVCGIFVSTLSSLSVVLCIATADMACLSLDEVNGPL